MNTLECTIVCFKQSGMMFPILVITSGVLISLAGYFAVRDNIEKLRFYWMANVLALFNAPVVYFSMACDMLFFLKLYITYAFLVLTGIFISPHLYRYYLKKKYGYERDGELERLAGLERVYLLNTSFPRAFTMGRDVFISAGMLEILDESELMAVLYHEKFHVIENKTPFLNKLKFLTFLPFSQEKIEKMADEYAIRMVGRGPLERAKKKLEEFYG
ncbi:M48 family metalloprotease [Geoglobus acetivorans]|uniref:Peptidase M48 domain-containing protein n=1 Tax=Geoglobus acetivorans TaxID=565033 RepID=A0A0A7GJJ3_GEOAI|nr:hypothetical protein GACE_2067 [Geoglobus acetivorans]